ncbi:hypothetical protein PUN28_013052 [Cardiocondyla obscurior]|uniref:Uncharacterized protein n=1 Tax=Cardiocondyla obscurior TaxID=286306 RepID=A0AAW2F9F9_9HYME
MSLYGLRYVKTSESISILLHACESTSWKKKRKKKKKPLAFVRVQVNSDEVSRTNPFSLDLMSISVANSLRSGVQWRMTNERETERNKRALASPDSIVGRAAAEDAEFVLARIGSFSRVSSVGIPRLRRKRDYFCRRST